MLNLQNKNFFFLPSSYYRLLLKSVLFQSALAVETNNRPLWEDAVIDFLIDLYMGFSHQLVDDLFISFIHIGGSDLILHIGVALIAVRFFVHAIDDDEFAFRLNRTANLSGFHAARNRFQLRIQVSVISCGGFI